MIKFFRKIRQRLLIENKFSKYLIYAFSMILILVISSFKSPQAIDPIEAGKQIYTKGTSPSKSDITAVMSEIKVPGSVLPCINCHGANGKELSEGGVNPSSVQWESLSQSTITNGRKRPAYSISHLKRVITLGIDSGGNALQKVMPKYSMTSTDMDYLIAYIKTLGKEE